MASTDYWDSVRDWGYAEFEKTYDIDSMENPPEGFTDWNEASSAYEEATGNSWETGEPKEETTETTETTTDISPTTFNPSEPSSGSLVSNNINDILNEDNALMRTAAAEGLELANSRGALNSDQAASASMSSMIDAAYPIAAADAAAWQSYDASKVEYDLAAAENRLQELLAYDANTARLADSLINGMTAVFRTPDAVWTQDMQTDVENIINAYTPWAAGLYDIPLTGSTTA